MIPPLKPFFADFFWRANFELLNRLTDRLETYWEFLEGRLDGTL